jgi:hypothetical protein
VRAAHDFDARGALQGLRRILTGLRLDRRQAQRRTRLAQATVLHRRAEQPVVANAFEARRQHMLQEALDEARPVDEDRSLPP